MKNELSVRAQNKKGSIAKLMEIALHQIIENFTF